MKRQFVALATLGILGACYLLEPGEQDFRQAERLLRDGKRAEAIASFEAAAKAGNPHAPARIAAIYLKSPRNPDDLKQGTAWAEQCARQGMAACSELLGLIYWVGLGTVPDLEKAKMHLRAAAAKGSNNAKLWLVDIEAGKRPSKPTQQM